MYKSLQGIAAVSLLLLVCGCGSNTTSPITTPPPVITTGVLLHGSVHTGALPIAGANVTLYAAGTTGYNGASTNLLSQPITTAADGSFSTAAYTCTAGQQLYFVATGGKINGTTANASAASMATLGECSTLTNTTFAALNERTTVASVYALSPFMGASTSISTSPTNTLGLSNAFQLVNNLVDTTTGGVTTTTLPTGATAPTSKLNTLADVLYSCNSLTSATACTILFQLATPVGGAAPTNTVDALLAVARHPALNTLSLYNLATSTAFTPRLSTAPPDWTLGISYSGGGLHQPVALAIDSTGSVWAANSANVATKLSPTGQPASASGFAAANLAESYGIAIDTQDSVWITNQQAPGGNGSLTKFSSAGQLLSGTGFTSGGIYFPDAIAADPSGNIWVADYGRNGVSLLAPDGTSLSGSSGYTSAYLSFAASVAVDSAKNAWFGTYGSVVRVTPAGVVTPYSCCADTPSGVAIDASGNVWLTDYTASALLELNSSGTLLHRLTGAGGLYYPEALTIDGNGVIWVANFQSNSVSAFSGGPSSTAISPATGYGSDAGLLQPSSVGVDASGNVWVANSAENTLTQFVGLASPTRTPIQGSAAKP
jgi:streptogramin lyase